MFCELEHTQRSDTFLCTKGPIMPIWTLHGDGKNIKPGEVVAPGERLSCGRTIGLGSQHVVSMFGATFVFPIIMGLNPQLAILFSGVCTLLFLAIAIDPLLPF